MRRAAPWVWGAAVAVATARFFLRYGPGDMHLNDEGISYVHRVVEFLSCLRAGYAFPQWAVDFRGGLGGPYFGYYQPGFFYLASLFATVLPVKPALGVTLIAFSFVGYGGMLRLVGGRFGTAAGILAGTMLLVSEYSLSEMYVRGDLSEYCGVMLIPVVLYGGIGWMEDGRQAHWVLLAVACGVLMVMHPVAALLGYAVVGIVIPLYAVATRRPRRALGAVGAMLVGGSLAAFFWVPLVLEWRFVQGDRAASNMYAYFLNFVDPLRLIRAGKPRAIPLNVPPFVLGLIAVESALLIAQRRSIRPPQWRLVAVLWTAAIAAAFMMTPASRPVWEVLPLLHRIQFPWRMMVVVTVATAGLTGCMPAYSELLAVAGIVAAICAAAWTAPVPWPYPIVETRADILAIFAHPDAADEWLPRGARSFTKADMPHDVRCDVPECHVDDFERAPGRLHLRITTPRPASATLPHYFFPVGWTATRDGVPLPLAPTDEGLMRIDVPAGGGSVDVTFAMTPGRRLGVALSAMTLAGLVAGILLARRRYPRGRHAPEPVPLRAGPSRRLDSGSATAP